MKPRITVNTTADGTFEIWINEAGRDLLVKELMHLSETSDHFHLGPEGMAEVEVATRPYRPNDTVLEYGKILFRTDEWAAKHFPHVLASTAGPEAD
jgi:hypothetical protein